MGIGFIVLMHMIKSFRLEPFYHAYFESFNKKSAYHLRLEKSALLFKLDRGMWKKVHLWQVSNSHSNLDTKI